jgi:hypothetical protein
MRCLQPRYRSVVWIETGRAGTGSALVPLLLSGTAARRSFDPPMTNRYPCSVFKLLSRSRVNNRFTGSYVFRGSRLDAQDMLLALLKGVKKKFDLPNSGEPQAGIPKIRTVASQNQQNRTWNQKRNRPPTNYGRPVYFRMLFLECQPSHELSATRRGTRSVEGVHVTIAAGVLAKRVRAHRQIRVARRRLAQEQAIENVLEFRADL